MAGIRSHSAYYDQLPTAAARRYDEKICAVGKLDPYTIEKDNFSDDVGTWPRVCHMDIVNYLVYTTSFVTQEEMRAWKGLQSYKYFIDGMVQEVLCATICGNALIRGKVNHSQKFQEPPLQPWVIAEMNGKILSAHCTCMTGLGEVCSHVGAMLFCVAAQVKLRDATTCTQESCKWKLPAAVNKELIAKGIQSLEENKDEEAVVYFTRGIEIDAINPLLYINRSAAYAKLKDFTAALEDAETTVQLRPDWPESYLRKGTILLDLWRNRHAYCALKCGLDLEPDNERLGRGFFESKLRMQRVKEDSYPRQAYTCLQDKSVYDTLQTEPSTMEFMCDPEFVKCLDEIRRDDSSLRKYLSSDDPRFMVCYSVAMTCDVNRDEADYSDLLFPDQHKTDLERFSYPWVSLYHPLCEISINPPPML